MGPAVFDPANIQRLSYDFTGHGFDAESAVAWLQRHIRPGPVLVIFDEVDFYTMRSGQQPNGDCVEVLGNVRPLCCCVRHTT
ncbi:hypothetical protein ACOMHN_048157 [Nucella lapillus]